MGAAMTDVNGGEMNLRNACRCTVASVLAVVLVAGCTSKSRPPANPQPTGSAGGTGGAASEGTTYQDVTLADNAVLVDAAAVHDGLRSQSGTTYRFKAGTAGLASLKPGQVVILAGTAVRKVTSVRTEGGDTVVETGDASLNEAIRSGKLGWSRRIDWNKVPRSAFQKAGLEAGLRPRVVAAAFEPEGFEFGGEVEGIDVSLKLKPKDDGKLGFELTAKRKNVMAVAAKGTLGAFDQGTKLEYDEGTGRLFSSEVRGLKGEADVEWHVIGVGSAFDKDTVSFSIPFSVPIPIEVGPIPMVLKVKSTLRFVPALVEGSSSGGSFKIKYDSDFGFSFDSPEPEAQSQVRDAQGDIGDQETVTAGKLPVGFAWGWEFPRLELGLAGTGTFAFLTFDQFMAGEFTPGTTLTADIPPCQRAELTLHAIAGYKIAVLGMTAASDKTTLWEKKFPHFLDNKPCTLTGKP